MPCIPSARDITCLHPEGILSIATVAFVARALQTLALQHTFANKIFQVVWQIGTLNL